MNIDMLKQQLPDGTNDIKLNLSSVLTEEGAPDLTQKQISYIALAVAYHSKNQTIMMAIYEEAKNLLTPVEITSAKSAATIMAMNNIYYRFVHLGSDKSFATMPARLRMNAIGNPGIDKIDFELACLAVSVINGCGMCVDAHTRELVKTGITKLAIQSVARIAAVLNAVTVAISLNHLG